MALELEQPLRQVYEEATVEIPMNDGRTQKLKPDSRSPALRVLLPYLLLQPDLAWGSIQDCLPNSMTHTCGKILQENTYRSTLRRSAAEPAKS